MPTSFSTSLSPLMSASVNQSGTTTPVSTSPRRSRWEPAQPGNTSKANNKPNHKANNKARRVKSAREYAQAHLSRGAVFFMALPSDQIVLCAEISVARFGKIDRPGLPIPYG